MPRTIVSIPVRKSFNIEQLRLSLTQLFNSHGYVEKLVKNERCWSKGDSVMIKRQNFAMVLTGYEILLQAWLDDAVTGESDLEGFVAVIPKKKMKKILEAARVLVTQFVS